MFAEMCWLAACKAAHGYILLCPGHTWKLRSGSQSVDYQLDHNTKLTISNVGIRANYLGVAGRSLALQHSLNTSQSLVFALLSVTQLALLLSARLTCAMLRALAVPLTHDKLEHMTVSRPRAKAAGGYHYPPCALIIVRVHL